jgi:hypothetical protein
VNQRAPVPTTHIEDPSARRKAEQVDAVLKHPKLSPLGGFVFVRKQSVMNVVAPKGAIDESERVIVISDFISRNGYGGAHQF